jgi:lysophospholipase L1-like esterase
MVKKYVLCFGDSNTWGVLPTRNGMFQPLIRLEEDKRWTGIAQNELGEGYKLLVDGNCGRTTVWEDPIEGDKCGKEYLRPCLWSQMPLDLVVIMLGTNDLKPRFALSAWDCAAGIEVLIKIVRQSGCGYDGTCPPILIISPIHIKTDRHGTWLDEMFGSPERAAMSREFARYYKPIADGYDCYFLDAALYANPCDEDGIHIDSPGHFALGRAVADKIREILS